MINIAFVIDTIATPSAGTEKQLLMLLNEIDKSKFKPYLICLRNSDWLQNNNLPYEVHILNVGSLFSLSPLIGMLKFKNIINTEKIDIVQTFFKEGNIFGTIAAKFGGCKIIISSRRNIGYWHNKGHIRLLRFLRKWTTSYLCNSEAAKDMTIKIELAEPDRFHIIYNGLYLDKFKTIDQIKRENQRTIWNIKQNEILIGAVANLRAVKNIDFLIETASKLMNEFTNLKFEIIGEGQMKKALQQKIDELNLTDIIHLAGRFDDITGPLFAFDIAVMPSLSESFSNSLIEYMAAKLPIAASDAGGNIEAITHKETGLLYSNNDKNGLYNCLRELILNRPKFVDMADRAQKAAFAKYDVNEMITNHQRYYLDLFGEANEKSF